MHTLYYAPGAASLVVHWLLIELDIPHELRLVDFAKRAQKDPGYLSMNPNGVVPTLLVDGQPRFEAAALVMNLVDQHPEAGFAPRPDTPGRQDYHQWMFHLANAVQPLFRLWWYPHEPAGEEHADIVRSLVAPRIEAAWQRIDDHLAAHGPCLLGDKVSATDFYLVMLMRWSRNMPRPASDWTHLDALARAMKARPSFRRLCESEALEDWS